MRTAVGISIAALIAGTALSAPAWAIVPSCSQPLTGWNFTSPSLPAALATDFEVFLPGDQVGCATAGYNSFQSPPVGLAGVTATYDPIHDQTVLEYTGTANPAASPAPFHFGFGGFVPGGAGGERLPPLAMEWTYSALPPFPIGVVGIAFNNLGIGVTQWFVLAVLAEFPDGDGLGNGTDGDETTEYFEFPFQGSSSFDWIPSAGTVELSDAQFFISDTPIPLSDLNPTDTPLNGNPGSQFTLLPGYPRIVPEPAGLAVLGVGLLGLAGLRRRRR